MRTLAPAPLTFVDIVNGGPAFGSYAGPLPRIDLGDRGIRARIARRKRWLYLAIVSEEIWISLVVVRTGYATTAFAFAYDRRMGSMLADETTVAPPTSADVTQDLHADGELARLRFGRARASMTRRKATIEVTAQLGALRLDATLDESAAPPPISAIAKLGDGLVSATEKRTLTSVTGKATIFGRTFDLDGAIGGYDYTYGLLPRHTRWRWGFAMGRTSDGKPFAFNVVEGFVGEAECAAFYGGEVVALPEPRFVFDAKNPEGPWRLATEGLDLAFEPGGMHRQDQNLLLVRSHFVQPVGRYRGSLRIGGRLVHLDGVPGVAEDQDVVW